MSDKAYDTDAANTSHTENEKIAQSPVRDEVEAPARRQSTAALNIVENPLKVVLMPLR